MQPSASSSDDWKCRILPLHLLTLAVDNGDSYCHIQFWLFRSLLANPYMHLSQPANHALIGEGVICLQFAVQSYSSMR